MEEKKTDELMTKIYVTTMYRYGSHEMHSYVIYAGFSKKAAVKAGLDEKDWRGGKYDHEVLEFAPGDQNKERRKK